MATALKTFEGQSIFDCALQTYGSLDYVFKIIRDNNLSNINDPVPAGLNLTFDKDLVEDLTFYNTVRNRSIVYNTDQSFEEIVDPNPEPMGIGVMMIESTFIIG